LVALRGALAERLEAEEAHRAASLVLARACQSASISGLTLAEIGSMLGITKQAVSQLVGRAIAADRLEWEDAEEAERHSRRLLGAQGDVERGFERRSFQCPSCRRFKGKPADRCEHCGDEMGTHNGDDHELNRAYGYAA
jgi:hypothetical protein